MSGGCYDYIHEKTVTLDRVTYETDAAETLGHISAIADRLRALGHTDAADATARVRADLDDLNRRITGLGAVWKSVEWWDSGDWGEDTVAAAVVEWRASTDPTGKGSGS